MIVKWTDTNGDGFVNGPADGDTYSISASGIVFLFAAQA